MLSFSMWPEHPSGSGPGPDRVPAPTHLRRRVGWTRSRQACPTSLHVKIQAHNVSPTFRAHRRGHRRQGTNVTALKHRHGVAQGHGVLRPSRALLQACSLRLHRYALFHNILELYNYIPLFKWETWYDWLFDHIHIQTQITASLQLDSSPV